MELSPVITSAFFSSMKRKLGKEKSPAGEKLPENLADVISQDFFSTIFHKRVLSLPNYKFQLESYKLRPHPPAPSPEGEGEYVEWVEYQES